MAKVFITQEPSRRDPVSGQMVPMMDFRKVLPYGEPIVCLASGRVTLSPAPMVRTLTEVLKGFCDDDYLVAAGDPSAIAVAGAIAARNNQGRMKMLKWDRESHQYIKVQIEIF